MLESLTDRLSSVFSKLTGAGRLSESHVDAALEEVRAALLEADVHFRVVRDLLARVREKAIGQEVVKEVQASDMLVKIFHDELVDIMSPDEGDDEPITYGKPTRPTVILMAGLQGSGKTTTTAKLAVWLKERKKKPLLVAADIQRPAAVEQLRVLGGQIDVPVFHVPGDAPEVLAKKAFEEARATGRDVVLIDTAGRLHIDDALMDELKRVAEAVPPDTTFFVCDAMTGQDAVTSASAFKEALPLSGVILTKLDGDTRGGAALSVRHVTGAPVRFVGVGEKTEDLQQFHADRLVGRILGMGDVVTLVEKAQKVVDEKEAEKQMKRMMEDRFTLDDFLSQLQSISKMGSLGSLLGHLPGMPKGFDASMLDDKLLGKTEAVILSMTSAERQRPEVIDQSRRRRIAKGSGSSMQAVTDLLKQFDTMRKMMSQMKKQGLFGRMMSKFTGGGDDAPGGMPDMSEMMGAGGMPGMPGMAGMPGLGGGAPRPTASSNDKRKDRKKERQRRKKSRRRR